MFNKKKKNIEDDSASTKLCNKLEERQNSLKDADDVFTNSEIDLEKKGKSTYPAFLWQQQIADQYHFFATNIGMIDYQLLEIDKSINFYSNFNDKEELKKEENKKTKLLKKRNKIVKDFLNMSDKDRLEIIREIIAYYPSGEKFGELYKTLRKDSYQLNLQVQFVEAYNEGFCASGLLGDEITDVFDKYEALYADLDNYLKSNQKRLNKIKKA